MDSQQSTLDVRLSSEWNPADPQPGIYKGVPFEEYAKARAVNNSLIKRFDETESYRGVKLAMERPEIASASKRFGTLFHVAALEPENFPKRVQLGGPVNPKTGKEYGRDTKAWAEFEEAHPGKVILAHEDAEAFKRMYEQVSGHPIARKYLLQSKALRELSLCWRYPLRLPSSDEQLIVTCKARPDAALLEEPVLVDLKTTDHPLSARALSRLFTDYGYYRAAALYADGWASLTGGPRPRFLFVVVQRSEPWECVVCELHEEFVNMGRAECHHFCAGWAECERNGRWLAAGQYWQGPTVHTDILTVPAPRWKVAQFSDGE